MTARTSGEGLLPLRDGQIATSTGRLAYSQGGEGPDVVLLHGALSARQDMLSALFGPLSARFRVTAFDRPGHGESEGASVTGTPWRQADGVLEAAETLGLRRPVVVGHSFGGAVALACAMSRPAEVLGVVALAPIVFPELRLEHLFFAPRAALPSGPMVNRLLAPLVDAAVLPLLWRAMFLPQNMTPGFRQAFPFDLASRRSRLEAEGQDACLLNPGLGLSTLNYPLCVPPVRILAGDRDMVVNNALHGQILARLLPNGAFQPCPGLGHMLHHFAQPAIVAAVEELTGGAAVGQLGFDGQGSPRAADHTARKPVRLQDRPAA
jgi:pimeloyl-ACP methyl ester carboxylesterase